MYKYFNENLVFKSNYKKKIRGGEGMISFTHYKIYLRGAMDNYCIRKYTINLHDKKKKPIAFLLFLSSTSNIAACALPCILFIRLLQRTSPHRPRHARFAGHWTAVQQWRSARQQRRQRWQRQLVKDPWWRYYKRNHCLSFFVPTRARCTFGIPFLRVQHRKGGTIGLCVTPLCVQER